MTMRPGGCVVSFRRGEYMVVVCDPHEVHQEYGSFSDIQFYGGLSSGRCVVAVRPRRCVVVVEPDVCVIYVYNSERIRLLLGLAGVWRVWDQTGGMVIVEQSKCVVPRRST